MVSSRRVGSRSPVLVDTSVFIDFLRKKRKDRSVLWKLKKRHELVTTVITEFELRVGARRSDQIEDIERLLAPLMILPLSSEAVRLAAREYQRLRGMNQTVGLPDILIASIGLQHNLPLATLNREHFARFPDMKLVDL